MIYHPLIKKVSRIILILIAAIVLLAFLLFLIGKPQKQITWGVTFSTIRAEELDYNPEQLFAKILNDLKPKKVRLPVYWSQIEPIQGQYDFSQFENLLIEANKHGTEIIIVLGKKQPRWPECHQPEWFNSLTEPEQEQATLQMIEKSVLQLQDNQSIVAWQLENEPFFPYGPNCPITKTELYKKEIKTIQQLDSKPIIATDSGEKGAWINAAWTGVDILGATMYREVYHDKQGRYITYPIPWWTYNIKSGIVKLLTNADEVIGVELQAEPWLIVSNPKATVPEEQLKHMNPDIFQNNIEYATKVGFPENYFWGVEWWYWMEREHKDSSMLNAAKKFFKNN